MGYNARNNEIHDNITRMRRAWEAERDALATVRRFNARLSAKSYVWFWPKITAAITAKHPWLVIACDSCGTVVDLDLRVKPRGRYVIFQMAEVAVSRELFQEILRLITELRPQPPAAPA
jgi:hypothetical protein